MREHRRQERDLVYSEKEKRKVFSRGKRKGGGIQYLDGKFRRGCYGL